MPILNPKPQSGYARFTPPLGTPLLGCYTRHARHCHRAREKPWDSLHSDHHLRGVVVHGAMGSLRPSLGVLHHAQPALPLPGLHLACSLCGHTPRGLYHPPYRSARGDAPDRGQPNQYIHLWGAIPYAPIHYHPHEIRGHLLPRHYSPCRLYSACGYCGSRTRERFRHSVHE